MTPGPQIIQLIHTKPHQTCKAKSKWFWCGKVFSIMYMRVSKNVFCVETSMFANGSSSGTLNMRFVLRHNLQIKELLYLNGQGVMH